MAMELRVPLDVMKSAWSVFEEYAKANVRKRHLLRLNKSEAYDPMAEGQLNYETFTKVLCKICGTESADHLPDGLISSCFTAADADNNRTLNFGEFALWYSRHGFSEDVLLSQEQREIRRVARLHGLPIVEVERYKSSFDSFDEDGSGMIEYTEFEKLVNNLIKVPAHLDLPPSRVRQFWTETDLDGSGAIAFEEFLLFYKRYFEVSSPCSCPFEEFYRALRPVAVPRAW